LISHLNESGWTTYQGIADADVDIVRVALQLAVSVSVAVVAQDTDIFALLIHHRVAEMKDVFFYSSGRRRGRSDEKCINIGRIQQIIGPTACRSILVSHALGGCDTTSAMFGVGKGTVYNQFKNDERNRVNFDVMQCPSATAEEVSHAGIQLMIDVYGGKSVDTLQDLRYSNYCRQVSSSLRGLQPERLPPSHNAAYYHVLRVHYQSVAWKLLDGTPALDPLQ
jgi:hypothetical protein